MFEILKALMALQHACQAHSTRLSWEVKKEEADVASTLVAEIPLWDADVEFINQMQAMFEPVDTPED